MLQAIFKLNILPELFKTRRGNLFLFYLRMKKRLVKLVHNCLNSTKNTFKTHNLHALLFPTSPIVAPLANEEVYSIETFQTLMRNTDPGSNIGIPGLSLPIGKGGEIKTASWT